jgi:hypothetical protein
MEARQGDHGAPREWRHDRAAARHCGGAARRCGHGEAAQAWWGSAAGRGSACARQRGNGGGGEAVGGESGELGHRVDEKDAAAGGWKRDRIEDEGLYEDSDPLGAH